MSSHQLLSQLNQQMPISVSASSTTINSAALNNDRIEVVTSTDSTPTQAISPNNMLAKFPAGQNELNKNTIVEEEIIEQQPSDDSQEAMVESVHAKTASLADKLSRSFFDLTQGSSDRLAKWKSKLQNYGQQQRQRSTEKDSSNSARLVYLSVCYPYVDE
jgi:uncharacterized membrane-anchored protein YhcB (DUF1043 family)